LLKVASGPLWGKAAGLNATPGPSTADAAPVAAASAAPALLLPFAWSVESGRGCHSNSPTAPLARPPKLRLTVPGPPFLGGLTGLKGVGVVASAGLRVAWWMGSALRTHNYRQEQQLLLERYAPAAGACACIRCLVLLLLLPYRECPCPTGGHTLLLHCTTPAEGLQILTTLPGMLFLQAADRNDTVKGSSYSTTPPKHQVS
jgi:hypothetical protein